MNVTAKTGRGLIGAAAVGLVAAAAAGCHRSAASPAPSPESVPSPAVVKTVHPERKPLRKTVEVSGYIEGFEQTAVYAKTSGYVREMRADIGDRVKKDQVIAVLSVPEVEDELRLKEAAVAQADAEVEQSKQALRVAEAAVSRAEANERLAQAGRTRAEASYVRWKAESERLTKLAGQGVSVQEIDQATDQFRSADAARSETAAAVEAARAGVVEGRAQRDRAAADVRVAEARRAASDADRRRTATLVGYGQIKAPFDGVVTRRHVHVGHLLQPTGAQATNGLPLFEVARTDPVRVFVDVPEADAALVQVGTTATVRVPAVRNREVEGRVARTSWALDGPSRTLRVQIDVANPGGELRPGMYALGRVAADLPDAVTVPASAVYLKDDQHYVVRVENGKAALTPVQVGRRQGAEVELLRKEVRPPAADGRHTWEPVTGGETIIAETPTAYADGQPVAPAAEDTRLAGVGKGDR